MPARSAETLLHSIQKEEIGNIEVIRVAVELPTYAFDAIQAAEADTVLKRNDTDVISLYRQALERRVMEEASNKAGVSRPSQITGGENSFPILTAQQTVPYCSVHGVEYAIQYYTGRNGDNIAVVIVGVPQIQGIVPQTEQSRPNFTLNPTLPIKYEVIFFTGPGRRVFNYQIYAEAIAEAMKSDIATIGTQWRSDYLTALHSYHRAPSSHGRSAVPDIATTRQAVDEVAEKLQQALILAFTTLPDATGAESRTPTSVESLESE